MSLGNAIIGLSRRVASMFDGAPDACPLLPDVLELEDRIMYSAAPLDAASVDPSADGCGLDGFGRDSSGAGHDTLWRLDPSHADVSTLSRGAPIEHAGDLIAAWDYLLQPHKFRDAAGPDPVALGDSTLHEHDQSFVDPHRDPLDVNEVNTSKSAGNLDSSHNDGVPLSGSGIAHNAADGDAQQQPSHRVELVFVDARADGSLLDAIASDQSVTRDVICLDASEDGIEAISHALANVADVDAIHIISHGNERGLFLGNTFLSVDNYGDRLDEISGWRGALTPDADILLYGCDLASTAAGQQMLEAIAAASHGDVAASSDATGSAHLGGNWDLEYSTGPIDAHPALRHETQHEWFGLLQAHSISGSIYEDVDGDGDVGDDGDARSNVTVKLYSDDGSGTPDGADTLVTSTTTNGLGIYTFSGVTDDTYWVVIDSKTVTASAGLRGGYAQGDVWAEQTYGAAGSVSYDGGYSFSGSDGMFYGGMQDDRSDDASALATAEHVTRVIVNGSDITGIDSGFSFNAVTTTRGGDSTDDDGSANRTVQGSLRQFIQNANAITAANAMRFVPAEAANQSSGADSWWRVTISQALPGMVDADTTIDGTAYSSSTGAALDTNTAVLGTGGTVGVDALALSQINGPELELVKSGTVSVGLLADADTITIRDLALYGFSSADIQVDYDGNLIEGCVIGSGAHSFADPGAGSRSTGHGILIQSGDDGTVQSNLIGFHAQGGIVLDVNSNGWLIEDNEIRRNGLTGLFDDGIGSDNCTTATIRGNLITDNKSPGIEMLAYSAGSYGSHTIVNNTVTGNAWGAGGEQWGIAINRTAGTMSANVIDRNIITDNTGPGVRIGGTTSGNEITQNEFYDNTGLGIDLVGTAGVTANDSGDGDSGANNLQNFPLLTSATTNGDCFTVQGSLNSTAGTTFRIEVFANTAADSTGYGEGERYLGSFEVVTNGSGDVSFTEGMSVSVAVDEEISATATDLTTDDTSEFAECITATYQNEPPLITSNGGGATANVNAPENQTAVTTVTSTDVDGGLPSYAITGGADAARFSIDPASGLLTFATAPDYETPGDANADGVYEVTVQVADGNGGTDSQALSVTVTNVNEPPVAIADAYSTDEDVVFSVNAASGVLANDTDPEGGVLRAIPVSGAANGNVHLGSDGSFSYTPNANTNGVDTFSYCVSDGTFDSATVTVTITVAPINDAPVAAADAFSIINNAMLVVPAAGVLLNDVDIDSSSLTAVLVDQPSRGAVALHADGSFTYVPDPLFIGEVTFTYFASDGLLNSAPTTVTIQAIAVPDNPVDPGDPGDGIGDDAPPTQPPAPVEPVRPPGEPPTDSTPPSESPSLPGNFLRHSPTHRVDVATLNLDFEEMGKDVVVLQNVDSAQQMFVTRAATAARVARIESHADKVVAFELDQLEHYLDAFKDQVAKEDALMRLMAATATSLFTGLSAGYVLWMLRGSYLAAALVSSLPAWARFDPIYVLDSPKKAVATETRHDDAESLADLIVQS